MKIFLAVLSLMCLMMFPDMGQAEVQDVSFLSSGSTGVIQDICSYGEGLAMLSAKGVFLLNPETGEAEKTLAYNSTSMEDSDLVCVGGQLYAVKKQTGEIFALQDEPTFFMNLPEDVFAYGEQGETQTKNLYGALGTDADIFLLYNSFTFESGDTYEVYRLNVASQQIEQLEIPGVRSLWSIYNGTLLISQYSESDDSVHPAVYDFITQSVTKVWEDIDVTDKYGLCLDATNDVLYYTVDSGKVYAISDKYHAHICSYLSLTNLFSTDKAYLLQGSYAYLNDGNLLIRTIQTEDADRTVLTIKGTADPQLVLEFSAAYPQIAINIVERTDDMEDLQNSLILSDESIDLYLVTSDGLFSQVKAKGYTTTLNESSILMEQVSRFYSWAQDVLMDGGNLIAVPASIELNYWTMNQTQWKALNLGDFPETMEELFNLISIWQEKEAEGHEDLCLFACLDGLEGVLKDLVRYYLLLNENENSAISFDREDFRNLMETAMQYEDVFQSEGEQNPLLMNYAQYFGVGYNDSDVVISVCPPKLTSESSKAVRGTMDLWIVNPVSNNKKEAMLFLEFWVTNMDTDLRYRIDESCTQPVRSANYEEYRQTLEAEIEAIQQELEKAMDESGCQELQDQLETKNERLSALEQNSWIISAEDLAIYQQIAPYIRIPLSTIYPDDASASAAAIDEIIERYASGQISIDNFVNIMDEKARMIFEEGQ